MSDALAPEGLVVIYDLEYTAWEGSIESGWSRPNEHKEIIEIGAVCCDGSSFQEIACLSVLVRPRINPILSNYITGLTGISNAEMEESGLEFEEAMEKFWSFCLHARAALSFGNDDEVIAQNYALRSMHRPPHAATLRNAMADILAATGITDRVSSCQLPARLGIETHSAQAHRALDDARAVRTALSFLRENGRL